MPHRRRAVWEAHRVVVKIGSSSLTDTSGHQVACHFSEVAVSISQSSVPVTA